MTDLDPDKIRERLVEVGDEWADKKAAYEALDDMTKTNLADAMSNHLPNCGTKAEAEMRALIDNGYKQHLADKAAARRAWLLAEVKWKTALLWAELRRSQESTKRAEMGMR